MRVLVVGPNGLTGRLIIPLLKAAGHEPIAMVRDNSQREAMIELGAEPVFGDLEKPLGYAVRNNKAVIFAAGSGSKTGPQKTIDVDQNGAMALIDSCRGQNCRRFIMLSSIAADDAERAPEKLHHYLAAKSVADRHLMNSSLDYTIVRPGYLSNDPPAGKIEIGADLGDFQGRAVTRADVAQTLVACLGKPNTIDKTFEMLDGDSPIDEALDTV